MGLQDGLIQLKGRVGNISFYKTKNGYAARKAAGIDGNRVKNDPNFIRTRENMAEFQETMKATKIVRAAFAESVKAIGDGTLSQRLSSLLGKLVRQDTVNVRGARTVLPATTGALEGFEFNRVTSLADALNIPFTPAIDRAGGSLSVDVPAFSPKQSIVAPEGATHIVLRAVAAELDFTTKKFVTMSAHSQPIGIDRVQQEAIALRNNLTGSTKPLFLAFGVSFVQILNGISYALKTGLHSAMQVVKVDTGVTV